MSDTPQQALDVDVGAYCRAIESHLCRKNDGHLIRISGPSFDLVRTWAEQGVPLKVACSGIDRTFDRYYRKGARRRPLHVSFCEADVLDAFDEWRRALGLGGAAERSIPDGEGQPEARASRTDSLPTHVDRVANRLTLLRGDPRHGSDLDAALEQAVIELDSMRAGARHARGAARAAVVARLEALDNELLARARAGLPADQLAALTRDALEALSPFRERMPPDVHASAHDRALTRLIREHAGLPTIRYDR